MYVTLTLFRVNPIFERDFIRYWHRAVDNMKGLGLLEEGVMHKESKISYISYIRWKNKEAFEIASKDDRPGLSEYNMKVRNCCNSMLVLHRMEIIKNNHL